MIKTGSKRPLELKDLGVSSKAVKPAILYGRFEVEWNKECEKEPSKRSLLKAILRSTGLCYWTCAMILNLISIFLNFVPTAILNLFVSGVEQGVEGILCILCLVDDRIFWLYAVILLLVPLVSALISSACQMMIVRIAISMKSMVSEAIYRKALRLSSVAKGSTSTGQLVNIMSSDTNSLVMFTMMVTIIITIPFIVFFSSIPYIACYLYCHGRATDGCDHVGCYRYLHLHARGTICRYWLLSWNSSQYHEDGG